MRTRFLFAAVFVLSNLAVEGLSARAEPPAQPELKVKFTMEGKPWPDVFEWLTTVTGKPVVTNIKPCGKFPCMDLLSKEYTIPQVVEFINDALQNDDQPQKLYLLNRERTFTLVPDDEQPEPWRLPRVRPENLKNHEDRELVSIVVPLKEFDADAIALKIKKVMGPFGDVVPMKHVGINSLILLDTVGNLKRICKMLDEGRLPPEPPPDLRRRTDPDFGNDSQFGMKWDLYAADLAGRRQSHESANAASGSHSPQRAGDPIDPRTVGARSEFGAR